MNWDQIMGDWKQFKGKVKERWGKLTDDELTTIAGKRDQLAGLLQDRYGYAKDQAERELTDFSNALRKVITRCLLLEVCGCCGPSLSLRLAPRGYPVGRVIVEAQV